LLNRRLWQKSHTEEPRDYPGQTQTIWNEVNTDIPAKWQFPKGYTKRNVVENEAERLFVFALLGDSCVKKIWAKRLVVTGVGKE